MRRGRVFIVTILIASLLAMTGAQYVARNRHQRLTRVEGSGSTSSLAGMNSFAMALLLGGLRGPLVMLLWTHSESQKGDKEMEGLDTQIEWIRLLQPEFDTVHIFQIWNKAYNLSVQMANKANKYTTILDAIEYGKSVERERSDNINILSAIGQIYQEKLGNSHESAYYKPRVRMETLPHKSRQTLSRNDPGWRRLDIDPMLDSQGNILPEYLKPTHVRPANLPEGADWNSGADLQYLAPLQPFKYGISPFGLAYNCYKRAQVLQSVYGQRHIQLSTLVVDSRPGLCLKQWAGDEQEQGLRAELKLFGKPVPAERIDMDTPTAPLGKKDLAGNLSKNKTDLLDEAIFSYGLTIRLCEQSLKEYQRHIANTDFQGNIDNYKSHMQDIRGMELMANADRDYLEAMKATGEARRNLLVRAREYYAQAAAHCRLTILKYYTDDEIAKVVFPKGYTRSNIQTLNSSQYEGILAAATRAIQSHDGYDVHADDRAEYERHIQRATERLAQLNQL